ncbi:rhomboid family intramembrane serine protease [Yoonia sp. 2307UL14-13]|uniref:rhomboid family intramembrane serine protease n=1 Tax=Yoonia sp. 2307UL14-13 TaxID=3126506 RepID=UPI0030A11CC4
MQPESPLNTIPAAVLLLALVIVGIEVIFQLANYGMIGGPQGVGWRLEAVSDYGFSARVFDLVAFQGNFSFDLLKRFVTYPFINAEPTQVAFCAALTLALGKFVGEYYGGMRVLIVYLVASVFGAVVFGLLAGGTYPLFGGFPPVYGLIGAYTYALWLRLSEAGENQVLAFRLIGVLLVIQLIYGVIFGATPTWIAELAGFVGGFAISMILAPGGWTAFVARMRQRS